MESGVDFGAIGSFFGDGVEAVIAFTKANEHLLAPAVFVIALLESIAFVSLLVPSTAILAALGVLIGAGELPFWPAFTAAAIGAFVGDWISYVLGFRFKDQVKTTWPLSTQPELFERGERFFQRYGAPGYFFGRFVGPLRAVFPLICGITSMRFLTFQLVNASSAVVWAGAYLGAGFGAGRLLS